MAECFEETVPSNGTLSYFVLVYVIFVGYLQALTFKEIANHLISIYPVPSNTSKFLLKVAIYTTTTEVGSTEAQEPTRTPVQITLSISTKPLLGLDL